MSRNERIRGCCVVFSFPLAVESTHKTSHAPHGGPLLLFAKLGFYIQSIDLIRSSYVAQVASEASYFLSEMIYPFTLPDRPTHVAMVLFRIEYATTTAYIFTSR